MQVTPTKYVFLSKTRDNPHLPSWYADQLEADMDPRTAQRMIDGKWVAAEGESIYHAYKRKNNYRDIEYEVNEIEPVYISWDFNIGDGKPMSVVLFQFIDDHMHIFDEVVIHGMRTMDSCEELALKGYLDKRLNFIITGDAAGKNRDTRSKKSDYAIISEYFSNYHSKANGHRKVNYEVLLPPRNPPIRTRHNLVNGYCENTKAAHRLTVYSKASTADKALRLTQLKASGSYLEDDSKEYQHIGTAIGYGLNVAKNLVSDRPRSRTMIV